MKYLFIVVICVLLVSCNSSQEQDLQERELQELYSFQELRHVQLGEGYASYFLICMHKYDKHIAECYDKVNKTFKDYPDITPEEYADLVKYKEEVEAWVYNLTAEEVHKLAQVLIWR